MSKARILIVDDDPITLAVIEERLTKVGYEIFTHSSTIGVSNAIAAADPDAVLLDVIMPGIRGDELAKLLGRDARLRNVPIILHSSKSTDELATLVRDTGAVGAIAKTDNDILFMGQFERLLRKALGRSSELT